MLDALLNFKRVERRFLVVNDDVRTLLSAIGPGTAYRITTLYLKREDGKGNDAYRLRWYDDEPYAWAEVKSTKGQTVTKRRMRTIISRGDNVPGFMPDGTVTYSRTAWELGDLRVTFDQNVCSGEICLPWSVVEVKGDKVASFLKPFLPPEARWFSKRSWVHNSVPHVLNIAITS